MSLLSSSRRMLAATLLAGLAILPLRVVAGPGAHGPNGEHLDGAAPTQATSGTAPRLEARSEAFELVATLAGGELSILVDRFATNEPVLGARIEVSAGSLKAPAPFHADHGDYAVADPAFLKALSAPGEHALVVAIQAGQESDLLDGVLTVGTPSSHEHGPGGSLGSLRRWAAIAAVILLVAAAAWWLRRRLQATRRGHAA
jgi:hypothetical protein